MQRFDVLAFLEEARRVAGLALGATAITGAVVLLERAGGPLSAVLGSVSVALAARLLHTASMKPARPDDDTPSEDTTTEAPAA